ncbi:MAG: hypothetical protein QOD26_3767, partial [Betaproteobacteria bacterium]|nr:hypothetical protein [Betaproteobacteria bacterium]
MNPTAIYSKSGKGVQEASGKTSFLDRGDRAVLSAIDGRATLADVAQKVGKSFDNTFQTLIAKLDKDGFVREASAGAAGKSAAPAAKAPAAGKPPPKPAGKVEEAGEDLDFSSLGGAPKAASAPPRPAAPPPRPAAPPPPPPKPNPAAEAQAKAQQSALQKAREEAENKAQAERDKQRAEAEAKIRAETESTLRAEALAKAKAEAEGQIRAEAEAKAKAVRDAAVKAAAEARAKAEAETKARQEIERKAKEEIERAKKAAEEEARRAREEAERVRKAAEEEARKAREEAELARKEAERARKEAEEAARKAREEAERKAKEAAEAMRRQHEEERRREEEERIARRKAEEQEQAERRKAREEEDRRHEEERAAKRKQREEADEAERREEEERASRRKRERQEDQSQPAAAPPPQAKKKEEAPAKSEAAGGLDSLMADLDSFTTREDEERKQKEESDRKANEAAAQRAREDAERQERAEAERKTKEEARTRKEEEKRRKREEEEELARKREADEERLRKEEEKRKKEADERERKAKADEVLAAKATRGPAVAVGEDTDEVRKRMVGRRGGSAPMGGLEAPSARRKKSGWGKPVAIALVLLLVAAVGVVHVLPVPTENYERAASEAFGRPVKIGEARISLITGLQLKFKDIRLGDEVRIASGAGVPEFEALRGERKVFSRIDLEGVELPQEAIGEALLAKVKGDNFAVGRVVVHGLKLTGPAPLPGPLEADLVYGEDGALRSATIRGPDTLLARITPSANAIEYVVTASGFPLPVLPEVTLVDFGMKGTATQRGMTISEWGGKIFGGSVSGTANLRWGSGWTIDGVVTARNINAAVFAPALLSEGRAEGTGRFSMSGTEPAKLGSGGRLEGNFTVGSGALGSIDLGRVIRSSGKEYAG